MAEKRCVYKCGAWNCGSYQFNLYKDDIDQGELCDVHYWQTKAQRPMKYKDGTRRGYPSWLRTHITWDERGVRTVNGIPDDAPLPVRDIEQEVKPCEFANGACIHCEATKRGECEGWVCPPQRPWVGLTNEDIVEIYTKRESKKGASLADLMRDVEATLKERNHDHPKTSRANGA